ncbi:uncharacterized protein METZ01_LOCUS497053 [marine metagenome]|uniref:Uncharacterized protein n=1 Tax=marine metagenome TaxID=408172 RepID=A0A383DIN9_9ZZZZ
MDLAELAYLLNSWRVFFALKLASPSGIDTQWKLKDQRKY